MTISKIKLVKLTQDTVVVTKTDGTIWGTKSVTELSGILTHNLEKQFPVLHNDYAIYHSSKALKLWNNALKKAKLSSFNYLPNSHTLNKKDYKKLEADLTSYKYL